jgi:hypothetical protein
MTIAPQIVMTTLGPAGGEIVPFGGSIRRDSGPANVVLPARVFTAAGNNESFLQHAPSAVGSAAKAFRLTSQWANKPAPLSQTAAQCLARDPSLLCNLRH